jgi:hypothetical protein
LAFRENCRVLYKIIANVNEILLKSCKNDITKNMSFRLQGLLESVERDETDCNILQILTGLRSWQQVLRPQNKGAVILQVPNFLQNKLYYSKKIGGLLPKPLLHTIKQHFLVVFKAFDN